MTPAQRQILDLIDKVNDGPLFGSWFDPSYVMAWCQIESAFRPHAYRFEPRLGEASYGLMQVLASTAKEVDPSITNPEAMYDPETGLRLGMTVAKRYFDQLQARLGREPTLEEWCDSYNRGVGGVLKEEHLGEDTADDAYTKLWLAAQGHWTAAGVDG